MAGGAAAAAGAAAARDNAIKASGVIVHVGADDFLAVVRRQQGALVVHATGWFFGTSHQYLTSYKGLAFYTKSSAPLGLPSDTELVLAKSMSVPG